MPEEKLTLVEHLEELRSRIIKSVIFIIIASSVLYNFSSGIISIITRPIGKVVFITPAEAFITNIKIAFFGGIFLSSPFILYHVWRFVSAGMKTGEKKYALIFGPLSFVFFVAGAGFGYFIIVPIGLKFLLSFATDFMVPMISVSKYVSFVGTLTLSFGAVFQLPLVILLLTKIGLVTPGFLSSRRRYAIVLIFIISAMLTPPDVITQCLMAVPLMILYELGIMFSKIVYKKNEA